MNIESLSSNNYPTKEEFDQMSRQQKRYLKRRMIKEMSSLGYPIAKYRPYVNNRKTYIDK